MLEKYKDRFPSFCRNVEMLINGNTITHAYLIDVGSSTDYMDVINAFVVEILKIVDDSIDYQNYIDKDNYSDYCVISPINGRWIKKEQILFLQEKYNTKSFYNNKKIYVIDRADDLSLSSGNTLLKFLEEPVDDVVAILITRNKYNVLPTIVSRCQLLKLGTVLEKSNTEIKDSVIKLLKIVKQKGLSSFSYLKSIDLEFENKDILFLFVEEVIKCYFDFYRIVLRKNMLYYNEYEVELLDLSADESINSISKKILNLENILDDIDFNINIRLFFDKLLMILVGVDLDV